MNPLSSSPPKTKYGSTKSKDSDKIGGRTIIDIHAFLDVLFVAFWIVSICARPTIISTIHLLLFGVYIIIGGILLFESNTKVNSSIHSF